MVDTNDMRQADSDIERLLSRWTLGNDAPLTLQDCPAAWQSILATEDEQQLPLTALIMLSQYQALMQPAQSSTPLMVMPAMPTMSKPLLPARLQPLAEYILQQDTSYFYPLLALLAQRGYSISPILWLQYHSQAPETQQIPAQYEAWQSWSTQHQQLLSGMSHTSEEAPPKLDSDTWGNFAPAERLKLLHELRQQDPDACRELIAKCITQESADKRLKIIEVLHTKLSENDLEFLRSLQQERSKKVRNAVDKLLARLTNSAFIDDDLEELISMLEVKRKFSSKQTITKTFNHTLSKIFGRKSTSAHAENNGQAQGTIHYITHKAFHNYKQRDHYVTLLAKCDLISIAKALSLSVEQLVLNWDVERMHFVALTPFAKQLMQLPEEYAQVVYQFVEKLGTDEKALWLNDILWPRMPNEQQQRRLLKMLKSATKNDLLAHILAHIEGPLPEGSISWAELTQSPLWQYGFVHRNRQFEQECLMLGLILPASLATTALDDLTARSGRLRVDPAFSSLLLNSTLASSHQSHHGTEHE